MSIAGECTNGALVDPRVVDRQECGHTAIDRALDTAFNTSFAPGAVDTRDLTFRPVDPARARTLDTHDGEAFNGDGFVTGIPLFASKEIRDLRAQSDREGRHRPRSQELVLDLQLPHRVRTALRLLRSPRLLDLNAWNPLVERLDGLTEPEYHCEPIAACWTVRRNSDDRWLPTGRIPIQIRHR